MVTITVRVTAEEKRYLKKMAQFKGTSLSGLLKTTTLDTLEKTYDVCIADLVEVKELNDSRYQS